MSRCVYLTATGPKSGKSAIVLGLVELLSRRVERVGFFRPIVHELPDNDLELIRARYDLPSERVGAAFTAAELRSLDGGSPSTANGGMARALYATAIAQASVAAIALVAKLGSTAPIWPRDVLGLTIFFGVLWLLSAQLFRKAANEQAASAAPP